MKQRMCPICETGQLHTQTEWIYVENLGQQGQAESHYSECDACGSEQAGATEVLFNKRAMVAFKKRATHENWPRPNCRFTVVKEIQNANS